MGYHGDLGIFARHRAETANPTVTRPEPKWTNNNDDHRVVTVHEASRATSRYTIAVISATRSQLVLRRHSPASS